MTASTTYSLLFLLLCRVGAGASYVLQSEDQNKPLFLTPYITRGEVEEGRELAKVKPLLGPVESYSGFLTVDEKLDKNLFFWYFPPEKQVMLSTKEVNTFTESCRQTAHIDECLKTVQHMEVDTMVVSDQHDAPVLLWLQGGPGVTSMYGLLKENGPYQLNDNGTLQLRDERWTKNFHMLYIDSPVGTGFSFAKSGVYDKNEDGVSKDLHEALTQFFKLFPDLAENEFFISGESYAGRYIPALAGRIHDENPTASQKINLVGLLIGDGMVDDEFMVYGDYLAQHGLIDLQDLPKWLEEEEKYKQALRNKDLKTAEESVTKFLNGITATGVSVYNFLKTKDEPISDLTHFFNSPKIRQMIHVGNVPFIAESDLDYITLWNGDFFMKVSSYTEKLLENYRVMHYNGQLDIICHYPMAEQYTNHLNWSRSSEFQNAPKTAWQMEGDETVAGFVKKGGNLYLVLVRNAGHMVPLDQPSWALDLVTKFVRNIL